MLRHGTGSGSSPSDTSREDISHRAASPLVTREVEFERLKKHSELAEKADKQFSAAEELIDKFENLNRANETLGKWAVTTEVEGKMKTFKETLATDNTADHHKFWELIEIDQTVSYQQTKMNAILLKNNSDLQCQVNLAQDIFTRTQTEAVENLKEVVKSSLELVKTREEESGHWKMLHHDIRKQFEQTNKDLRIVQKKADELQNNLTASEDKVHSLTEQLKLTEKAEQNKDAAVSRLTQDLQESRRKIQHLQQQLDQKTDELAAMDTDVRKAIVDHNQQREKHQRDLEKYTLSFEQKMNDELDKQEKQLREEHSRVMEQVQNQMTKLENERLMLMAKLEDYKGHAEEFRRENDYLKKNAKQIKQDLMAQCQRRVFSVLNYDSQSSDSPPPARYAPPPVSRSRSVNFVENSAPHDWRSQDPEPAPAKPHASRAAPPPAPKPLPPTTSQVRQRPKSFLRPK